MNKQKKLYKNWPIQLISKILANQTAEWYYSAFEKSRYFQSNQFPFDGEKHERYFDAHGFAISVELILEKMYKKHKMTPLQNRSCNTFVNDGQYSIKIQYVLDEQQITIFKIHCKHIKSKKWQRIAIIDLAQLWKKNKII